MAKLERGKVIGFAKDAGKFVGECSSQALICGIARALLPPQVSIVVQGASLVGGLLVGGFIGKQMNGYVEDKVDETVKKIDETKKNFKTVKDDIERLKETMKETPEK